MAALPPSPSEPQGAVRATPLAIEWLRAASRFAWPAAVVVIAAIVTGALRGRPATPMADVRVQPSQTVIKSLNDIGRLETTALHVEKVIDVRDHQTRAYGLIEGEDSMLFVASGEVIVGIDLMRLHDGDAQFDEATKTARLTLPAPEVLSTRFDEIHSYVHSRETDLLAKRNEQLEAIARRQAIAAFEAAGRTPECEARAKDQAEKQLRTLAKAWGAHDVVIAWSPRALRRRSPLGRPSRGLGEAVNAVVIATSRLLVRHVATSAPR